MNDHLDRMDKCWIGQDPKSADMNEVRGKKSRCCKDVGVNDGEKSVNQREATCSSPNTQQERSTSSQVAAVNATAMNGYGAFRNQHVLRNKTAITTADENKFFDPVGKQDFFALLSRLIPFSGRA